jgi:hypothetical protein
MYKYLLLDYVKRLFYPLIDIVLTYDQVIAKNRIQNSEYDVYVHLFTNLTFGAGCD